jgi:F-type H+-transporting ATPase subunit delta
MRDATIAKNYAEALLALARKAEDPEGWGTMIAEVSAAVQGDLRLRRFLEAPQVSADQKSAILSRAFADRLPRLLVRYLQTLVRNRRQMLIPEIAVEYQNLLDESANRLHANVTVAREPNDADRTALAAQLSKTMGKTVVPHVIVNPAILGGVIVRVGDRVMDGSVRKRLATLRSRLVAGSR